MKDFGLASLVYIGVNVGIYIVGGLIVVVFTSGGYSYLQTYTVWLLVFCAVVGAGYIYAVKRKRERMRRITLLLPLILAIHIIGSLAWPYIEPLLNQARN